MDEEFYIKITPEVEAYNTKLIEDYIKRRGFAPRIFDYDDDGRITEYGTDADYDTHATDVMNGYGYYDSDGWYHGHREYSDNGEYLD